MLTEGRKLSAFSVSEHVQQLLVGGADSADRALVLLVGWASWASVFVLHWLDLRLLEAGELQGVHLDVAADVVAFAIVFKLLLFDLEELQVGGEQGHVVEVQKE